MEEKNLSEKDSLALISQMIQVAKEDHYENGDGWLIWGWLLFIASVLSVAFSYTDTRQYISIVWWGILVLGLIIYVFAHVLSKKRKRVRTYVQELLDRLGTGFFISLFALIGGSFLYSRTGPNDQTFVFGYYYILYAFWMFIHGSAIHFRPLIIGAIVNWIAGMAIFFIQDFKYDMMISALAILLGYLVPGYLLRAAFRRKTGE